MLPKFNPDIHHVGLGESGKDTFGFFITGGYRRAGQRFGAATDFGGQNDLIGLPSLSRWTQDDFSGGQFSYSWGKDPAMFASASNLIPSQYDRTLRTCPPLVRYKTFDNGGRVPIASFASDGFIYCVFSNGIARFDTVGGAAVLAGRDPDFTFGNGGDVITAAVLDRKKRELLIASDGAAGAGAPGITRLQMPDPRNHSTGAYTWNAPNNGNRSVTALAISGTELVCQCGARLWTMALPEDRTSAPTASPLWTAKGTLPGDWVAHAVFGGQLYILCYDKNSQATTLVVYDAVGGTVLPVTDFPYNFKGNALTTYAGRLYVGGSGQDFNGGDRYGELYEITGASLRAVRTFAPESAAGTADARPRGLHALGVHEGLLFFGDTGRSLTAYDVTRDGFFGGPTLQVPDGVREIRSLVSVRQRLYAFVHHPGDSTQDGLYRPAVPADALQSYSGTFVSADFGPEPDRLKRWSIARVLTRYGGVTLSYSSDGGVTWANVDGSLEQRGDLRTTSFDLSSIPLTRQIRLRLSFPRGADVTGFTELIAFTLGFVFLDTGKWSWSFTINASERVEPAGGFGDSVVQNLRDIGTELRRYWEQRVPLDFIDLDGATYRVQLADYQENQPVILPMVEVNTPELGHESGREAYHNVTLVQV